MSPPSGSGAGESRRAESARESEVKFPPNKVPSIRDGLEPVTVANFSNSLWPSQARKIEPVAGKVGLTFSGSWLDRVERVS